MAAAASAPLRGGVERGQYSTRQPRRLTIKGILYWSMTDCTPFSKRSPSAIICLQDGAAGHARQHACDHMVACRAAQRMPDLSGRGIAASQLANAAWLQEQPAVLPHLNASSVSTCSSVALIAAMLRALPASVPPMPPVSDSSSRIRPRSESERPCDSPYTATGTPPARPTWVTACTRSARASAPHAAVSLHALCVCLCVYVHACTHACATCNHTSAPYRQSAALLTFPTPCTPAMGLPMTSTSGSSPCARV
jgi:hypothetical protein